MPEWVIQILTAGAGAAGMYAAIRADLATLHARMNAAHERIDFIQKQVFKQ